MRAVAAVAALLLAGCTAPTAPGLGGFALQGLAPGPDEPEATFAYVEFTPIAGGRLATWWAHALARGHAGAGQVRFEPGHVARRGRRGQ